MPDVETAGRERFLGSPSIQIDGQDVEAALRGQKPSWSCRTYRDAQGSVSGAPPVEMIRSAIHWSRGKRHSSRGPTRLWYGLISLPGALAGLLPVAVCPLCLPAFLGFLSAIGLGFLLQARFLLPFIVSLLILALAWLAYKAHRRRGCGPLAVGVAASGIILMSKFLLNFEPAIYFGVALLIGASIWNAWPRKADHTSPCSSCIPTGKSE